MSHKLFAIFLLPLSLIIGLTHLEIVSIPEYLPISYVFLGVIAMFIFEAFALFRYFSMEQEERKITAIIIPTILVIPAVLTFFPDLLPSVLADNLNLILASFMFTEGLYALH
ncbi:hypothetical protein CL620_03570 [archaeon]|jgi:hypothetical protein|nr:hypothetical protein [archaeon]